MSNWLKYFVVSLIFLVAIVFLIFFGIRHQTNIVSTQEVEGGLESVNVGEIREDPSGTMDKQSIISNLLLSISESHKEQGMKVKINYVFLDENEEVTENDDDINSVQFEVLLLGKDDRVESTSRQRIELDEVMN